MTKQTASKSKKNIIVGPPCSGKSTYVTSNHISGDVLVDYDALAKSLGAPEPHNSEGCIRSIAFKLRQSAINKILEGIECDSWIIHTNPSNLLIDKYAEAGCLFTLIDPGEEVCKERAEIDNRPKGTIEAIEKWYKNPPPIPGEHKENKTTTQIRKLQATLDHHTNKIIASI